MVGGARFRRPIAAARQQTSKLRKQTWRSGHYCGKAGIFQALGHPTRVAIVEYLRNGELSVGRLCEKVGIEQANASQHLAVLRNKHLVESRKEGNQIFYRLRDPLLGDVLEMMRTYFFAHMNEAMQMLKEEQREEKKAKQESGR
jgi:DNA-binding transcriptional ArsR family regulator